MNFDDFPKYFLGANSAAGFINKFGTSYSAEEGYTAYIIKGGPGTGKSTLMKKVAEKAHEKGKKCILCPCSSDPDSLDGVILPETKTVLLDGTPPHTVEPRYPAICEQIINTGEFWDKDKIAPHREHLLELFTLHKAYHKKAAQYIRAAGEIAEYNFSAYLSAANIEKAFNFGTSLAEHTIPETENKGSEQVRFLSGITPKGYVYFGDTIEKECKTQIVISDKSGAVGSIILSVIRDIALARGHKVITVKNCLLPDTVTDHILLPELSLAFVTENAYLPSLYKTRRIRAERFTDTAALLPIKQKLNFNRKIINELIISAGETLATAKALHDKIEKYYVNSMDFVSLNNFTDKKVNMIVK